MGTLVGAEVFWVSNKTDRGINVRLPYYNLFRPIDDDFHFSHIYKATDFQELKPTEMCNPTLLQPEPSVLSSLAPTHLHDFSSIF